MLEKIMDPRTRKEVTFVVGKIDGVYFNELKNIKTYAGPNGPWTPTHTVNVVVDGTRVGFGLTEKDAINSQDTEGNYHKLDRGMEVSVEITDIGEYNGNPQYSSKASKVTVLDATAEPQQATGGQKKAGSGFKRDNTGVVAGNGFNAAKAFLGGCDDENEFIQTAKKLVDIGQKLRDNLKESRPDLDDYSVGAQSGMALIAACEWAEDIEDVEVFATDILNNILPEITEYVKSLEEEKPAVVKKTVAKKTAKKTTKKTKVEASPEQVDDSEIPVDAYTDEVDDDTPF